MNTLKLLIADSNKEYANELKKEFTDLILYGISAVELDILYSVVYLKADKGHNAGDIYLAVL